MYTFPNGQLFSTLYRRKRCFGVTLCGNGVSYARHSRDLSGSSNVSEAPGKTKNEKKYFPEKLHLNVKPTLSENDSELVDDSMLSLSLSRVEDIHPFVQPLNHFAGTAETEKNEFR